MLFNSLDFALFLPLVFLLYWFVGGASVQRRNLILLAASYVFYGWWDWRFLSLLAASTLVDYLVGRGLDQVQERVRRKALLVLSLAVPTWACWASSSTSTSSPPSSPKPSLCWARRSPPRGSTSCCRWASASTPSRR
jgi:D-alanyl-lipoteichoic acid acyltransferase DltB (MBOAT superfamily)